LVDIAFDTGLILSKEELQRVIFNLKH